MPDRLEPDPLPRRDFLGMAGLFSAGLAIFGSIIGMARLPKPRVTPEASRRFRAGRPEEFIVGTTKIIPKRNVYLIATEEGIAAMSLICTHLGCIVQESAEGFSCPCHGSKFDAQGKVTGGPAPRALPWLAVSQAADGTIIIDTGKEVEAQAFFQAQG